MTSTETGIEPTAPSVAPGEYDELVRAPRRTAAEAVRAHRRSRMFDIVLAWTVPAVLFIAWQVAAWRGSIDVRFFPAPLSIWRRALEMIEDGDLQHHVMVTSKRVLLGFGFGTAVGVGMGLLMGRVRRVRAALEPTLNGLYTVPKLSLLPLLLLIFGIGETPRVLLIAITVFFFMWISTMSAVVAIPEGYSDALRTFGASRINTFRHVLVPAILPQVFVSMRVSAGVSILTVVGVEFVQASDGVGYLIWHSWGTFLAKDMYVGIVTVALMGIVFTMLIQSIGRLLLPWQSRPAGRVRRRRKGTNYEGAGQ